mgnify:CR=1 FL=1
MKCKPAEEWFLLLWKGEAPLEKIPSYLEHLINCDRCLEEFWSMVILQTADKEGTPSFLLSKRKKEEKRIAILILYLGALQLSLQWKEKGKFDVEPTIKLMKNLREIQKELKEGKILPEKVIEEIKKTINILLEKRVM